MDKLDVQNYEELPSHAYENFEEPCINDMIPDKSSVDDNGTADVSKLNTFEDDRNPPVYPSSSLWLFESVLLIMTLASQHKLTGEALADIMKLIDQPRVLQ